MKSLGCITAAILIVLAFLSTPALPSGGDPEGQADEGKNLYAAVFSVRGSVSGRSTGGFGVFIREDQAWRQITLSNVFTFGLGFFDNGRTRRHYIAGGNGLHRSSDGGESWRILTSWETMEVLSVVPHPVDSAIVYIATPWGVFKTVDDGETWVEKMNGMRRWFVEDLLMDWREERTLYAGSEDDLYRTTDGGELWKPMGVGDSAVLVVLQHPVDHDLLLAGVEDGGIRFTTDGGATWQGTKGLEGMSVYAIAASADGKELYAAGWETGLCRSQDNGRSWSRIWNHPDVEGIFCIFVDPSDSRNIYLGTDGDGVFESHDRGKTWRHGGLEGGKIKQIAIYPGKK
jgi:photosystem II stability/assembly factor-like uncharacterized protein